MTGIAISAPRHVTDSKRRVVGASRAVEHSGRAFRTVLPLRTDVSERDDGESSGGVVVKDGIGERRQSEADVTCATVACRLDTSSLRTVLPGRTVQTLVNRRHH